MPLIIKSQLMNRVYTRPKCSDKDCCNANECAMTIKEDDEAKIRKTLRNYYLNPLLKCTEKLEYPYSSFLQLIVIICISIQVCKIHYHVLQSCILFYIDLLYYV